MTRTPAPRLRVAVETVGLIGPGLTDWSQASPVLRGDQAWVPAPTAIPAALRLPAAERRRVGAQVKLAMGIAEQAFTNARARPESTATVFISSSGDGDTCHALSMALLEPTPLLSPTRFTNSVHNVASGYWSIAVGSMAPSTSLCAHDGTFCAGLLEAATMACADGVPVALIAYEVPYPEPIRSKRPISESFGLAMVVWPDSAQWPAAPDAPDAPLAWLDIAPAEPPSAAATAEPAAVAATGTASTASTAGNAVAVDTMAEPGLEHLRTAVPTARCLPLLARIARRQSGEVVLDAGHGRVMRIGVGW